MYDFSRMQKLVDRMQKLQPPQPPPDTRFLPEELKKEKVIEDPKKIEKKTKRQLLIKNKKGSGGLKPVEDERLFLIQKENYLKKKQRELEMEQVKKELAEQKKQEKQKLEIETQRALQFVKGKKELSQLEREEKIKKKNDNEFLKRKQKVNNSIQMSSIDASYVSQNQNLNNSLIKKQIIDYHTLPKEQYNRIYRQQAVSPPK
ncbi:unnamed protein product (macronuclear) [Paramecium tetraurelia]|uniref:Uncharacterized protein n=1 Tax=Paramecium tetraurelia TaxID=5888 RepID=A0BCS8_PARTE|nr:uncharacterized protein GSPATT00004439001 [Paramecium tetraurelia]CAK56345.1 unnamed protein product [Paramecium tetraurelia]|eukprot:XP_001423743.1 hypothetical protein (macronuclear) [Paramecium tetraurelia strain d4-2]